MQQLYKDKHTRAVAQTQHHPNPYIPLAKKTVTDVMKICSFCDPMEHSQRWYFHGDSIHLHAYCSNTRIAQIHDRSNTDIFILLQHLGTLFTNSPYPHNLGRDPFRTFLCHLIHQYDDNTQLNTVIPDLDLELHPYHHSIIAPRNHHNITTCPVIWKQIQWAMTPECSDYRTYFHGMVSSLPSANYSRASMNFIDHPYIVILPRSAHTTINRYFIAFVQQHQCTHERYFNRLATTAHIMGFYWDNAISQPAPLRTLHCLNPPNNMKLYILISKALNKVVIVLLQRARHLQTIIETLVYNRSRTGSILPTVQRVPVTIPASCGRNIVQTILRRQIKRTPTVASTQNTPYDHDRCNLYAAAHTNRGTIKGCSLFCLVCKIFNHTA